MYCLLFLLYDQLSGHTLLITSAIDNAAGMAAVYITHLATVTSVSVPLGGMARTVNWKMHVSKIMYYYYLSFNSKKYIYKNAIFNENWEFLFEL
jgi:hypothetical protein